MWNVFRIDFTILLGAAFTLAVCISLGRLWLRLVDLPLVRLERRLLAFLCGAAVLSGIVFLLCTVHAANRGVLGAIGIAAMGAAWRLGAPAELQDNLPKPSQTWRIVFAIVVALYCVVYFFNSMAPEISPDGTVYHLWLPQQYLRAHAFVRLDSFFANMPQGLEMLFLFALAFGRNSSAALVHLGFLLSLPLLVVSYGRRAGIPNQAAAAALFVFLCPVAAVTGTTAYNDIAAAVVIFAVFHLIQMWLVQPQTGLLTTAGLLCGFAYSIKYTAAIAILYALALVIWKQRRAGLGPAVILILCAAVFIVPWSLKNWIWAGNPVSPFANRLFPNPNVHVSFEEEMRHALRHYDLKSWREFPAELTMHGATLGGILGPLYLAAPVALLALGRPVGRRILLAALVFLVPYASNIGTRFLLPALPFVSLAMAIALDGIPILLVCVVVLDAVVCWPSLVNLYSTPGSWRLTGIPVTQALRLESEDALLSRESLEYRVARMIEQLVPAGKRVFAFSTTARAYTHRDVLASYESGPGEVSRDLLWTAVVRDWHPSRRLVFVFPARILSKVRLVQTATTGAIWSIAEIRFFANGVELPRSSAWRLTANPNPWDVQFAFDNSPVTRWRSWCKAEPGMYIEIDFSKPAIVDAIQIQRAPDEDETTVRVDGMQSDQQKWIVLADHSRVTDIPINVNLRAASTTELRRRGFDYVLVGPEDIGSDDFHRNTALWNLEQVGERSGWRLYQNP